MRLAVLASGSGTILQSIIEAGVEVTLVVTLAEMSAAI